MRFIPNEKTWVGFTTARPANLAAPTASEIAAATVLTGFLTSLTATATGNTLPTPNLDSLYETSVPGTVQAAFSAEFYQDDTTNTAWTSLPRSTVGYFFVSRFGGTGTNQIPQAGDTVEVWPIKVSSRTPSPLASNTIQTFTCNATVPEEPQESATVAASGGVPSAPANTPSAVALTATTAQVDWDPSVFVGAGLVSPFYKVYRDTTAGGAFATLCTVSPAIVAGMTTATVTGLTTATTYYFKVKATNAAGDSPFSLVSNAITTP